MNKTYVLTLNEKDMCIINDALIAMPFRDVAQLINKINNQIYEAQQKDEYPMFKEKNTEINTKSNIEDVIK